MKFYAVRKGRKVGIFNTWQETKENVDNFSGAEYKSFNSIEAAQAYLNADKPVVDDYSDCDIIVYTVVIMAFIRVAMFKKMIKLRGLIQLDAKMKLAV